MIGILGFLFWLGFCAAVAVAADTRGRDAGGWFVLAFLISPLLAVCFLLALPARTPEQVKEASDLREASRAASRPLWRIAGGLLALAVAVFFIVQIAGH